MVDPWVALAAMSMTTERIRLGTTLTPLARRRPWKLARETVTLDHLSNGRLTLTVGLGAPHLAEFGYFSEQTDSRVRAGKLDEGLQILAGLWSGKPFAFSGKYYHLEKVRFQPTPLQSPCIPIWVGGYWPNRAPFRRAARWDGAFPLKHAGGMTPKDFVDVKSFIDAQRAADAPFDLVSMGYLLDQPGEKRSKSLESFSAVGVTWWLESFFRQKDDYDELMARIEGGPPASRSL